MNILDIVITLVVIIVSVWTIIALIQAADEQDKEQLELYKERISKKE